VGPAFSDEVRAIGAVGMLAPQVPFGLGGTMNELDAGAESTGDDSIIVDFPVGPGRQQVALSPEEVAAKSARALDRSMDTIRQMAARVNTTMESLGDLRPDGVQVTFGIRFDAQAGAVLTKAGIEANLEVRLSWNSEP
jgi:Trypsin-co-occurring domain 1